MSYSIPHPVSILHEQTPLLDRIHHVEDLRRLTPAELLPLAKDLRLFILRLLNEVGGHFAANLGTIEITIALHYLFNTPADRLIWDVGHQSLAHKIITDRKHHVHTLRKKNGLASFPSRDESPFDAFGVGHSSTSISAALGMACADPEHKHIAVIGDGAMTAGMAFEALNHGGDLQKDILIVFNDNAMSISENVGALSNYAARLLSSRLYKTLRQGGKKALNHFPSIAGLARRTERHIKGFLTPPGLLFEELGFHYIGPIDGHDLPLLLKTIRMAQSLSGPQFLHIITQKGKGYGPAEKDPVAYHAVSKGFLQKDLGLVQNPPPAALPQRLTYSQVFGHWLCDMAAQEPQLVGITPAMCEGSDLIRFSQSYPDRYYDVGIAEQHAVTFAAGMACAHKKPVVAIYSTFLQRAYDQLIHDVAIQQLPVLFAIDRAGLVPDGPTHSGAFDISYLLCIPQLCIMAPSDEQECYHLLSTGFYYPGPACVRYPRRLGIGLPLPQDRHTIPLGQAMIRRHYAALKPALKVALLCFGPVLHSVLSIVDPLEKELESVGILVVDMRFIKPLDMDMIQHCAQSCDSIVTIEENAVLGGVGSAINRAVLETVFPQKAPALLNIGIPDIFVPHASQEEMLAFCGLDSEGLFKRLRAHVQALLGMRVLEQSF